MTAVGEYAGAQNSDDNSKSLIQHNPMSGKVLDVTARFAQAAWLIQAAKFSVVGVLNTMVDGGLYFALTRWAGLSALPVLAKGISYSTGVLNSFYWNRRWTFQSERRAVVTLASFVVVNLIGLGLNAGIMHICLEVAGLHELLSLSIATGAAFIWNFTISKAIVFRQ